MSYLLDIVKEQIEKIKKRIKDQDIESMKSLVRTFGSNEEEKAALEAIVTG